MPVGPHREASAAGLTAGDAARLAAEIDDLFLPDDARLDDRTRAAVTRRLADIVRSIEAEVRRHAARLLAARFDDAAAEAVLIAGDAFDRLTAAGVLRAPDLMAEMIGQVRLTLLAERLPVPGEAAERSGLLVRLTDLAEGAVASAARALLVADSRRSGPHDLPAELLHRLVWLVAATMREGAGALDDRLIADAARRSLATHDEGDRPEALAARLAAAIDPLPNELPALLSGTIDDRRPVLFVAVLARTLGIDAATARALLIDPTGDGLWPALRAVDMVRADIARIALALADADPRRDIEAFADRLDEIAAMSPKAARAMLAPLTLPVDFRAAIAQLGAGR